MSRSFFVLCRIIVIEVIDVKRILQLFYKYQKEFLIGIFILILMFGFFVFYEEPVSDTNSNESSPIVISESEFLEEKEEEQKILRVDVKGAVLKEGVYEVDEGSCVLDVIRLAGGLNDDADTSMVNLSKQVTDQMMIVIPTFEEVAEENNLTNFDDTDDVYADGSSSLVSINHASLSELQTLPGIGEKKALDIISYREENGGFQKLEDLKNVKGIGDRTFENLKEYIEL